MRRIIVSLAASALLAGLSGCVSSPFGDEAGQPADGGITGATINRPAVAGDRVDFGTTMNSVENDDLATQSASASNPVAASDTARDKEIDSIVDTISNDNAATAPGTKSQPAVPPLAQPANHGTSNGVTGSIARTNDIPTSAADTATLPPVPSANPTGAGDTSGDAGMAADQARLFPKPLWRRVRQQQSAQPANAPPSLDN